MITIELGRRLGAANGAGIAAVGRLATTPGIANQHWLLQTLLNGMAAPAMGAGR
jgi:hypothetical protein